jgi:glucokinase
VALLDDLRDRHGHVSYERVLSGDGLHAIYRSLAREGLAAEDPSVERRLDREDPAAVIAELGMSGEDPLCHEALDLFASVYGAFAGNLALIVQARGGVFVAGGIAPRILPKLRDGSFVRAFQDKGRVAEMLEEIPVFVVTREDVGLLGAAVAALEEPDQGGGQGPSGLPGGSG